MYLIKNILVPTDFSAHSAVALELASAFVSLYDAKLHLIHVQVIKGRSRKNEVSAKKELDEFSNRWFKQSAEITKIVRTGQPYREIVTYANEKKIDLIIIATHGRTGLTHMLMGSVAEKVVRYSPVPVLSIRPPEVREWLVTQTDVEENLRLIQEKNSD